MVRARSGGKNKNGRRRLGRANRDSTPAAAHNGLSPIRRRAPFRETRQRGAETTDDPGERRSVDLLGGSAGSLRSLAEWGGVHHAEGMTRAGRRN